MIRSMTGYGYYKYQDELVSMDVEIKTVNHRYCDVYIRMPRQLSCFEDKVRSLIMSRVFRGKVDVFINWENLGEGVKKAILDKHLALEYYNAMSELAEELQLRDDVSSLALARFPGILRIEKKEENSDEVWSVLEHAVNKALDLLIEMREAEGEKLKASLVEICKNIENYRLRIKEREPLVVAEYKEKLSGRIQELMTNDVVDQSRLAMEVAIFADKCSINEELVRLKSHIDQFLEIMNTEGPTGRKIDFLLQEMNREVNTIGAKANDLDITKNVIELKSEIEKIREQVQNVE